MLEAKIKWTQGLSFDVSIRDHQQKMDAKKDLGGEDLGPNPKEFVLAGLCGCTGMDVVSLLKKFRISYNYFEVSAESEQTTTHPHVFSEVHLHFMLVGENIEAAKFEKAADLSMTRYCGVSAMLSKAVPIYYHLHLNGSEIKKEKAHFAEFNPQI